MARLNSALECLSLPLLDADIEETPLQGDLFLLQSVPSLERNVGDLPSRVHLVGAAIEPLPALPSDLDRWLSHPGQYLYVQQGRTFDGPGFLDTVIGTFADAPVRVIVDSMNIDMVEAINADRAARPFFDATGVQWCSSAALSRCCGL